MIDKIFKLTDAVINKASMNYMHACTYIKTFINRSSKVEKICQKVFEKIK